MITGSYSSIVKRTSALRRVPTLREVRVASTNGQEGDVCVFELPEDALPITVESASGRMMEIAPGDPFLATPGHRQSRRWAVGLVPDGGLVPGNEYWVLCECGVIGELLSHSDREMSHLGRVRYLGTVCGEAGAPLNIRQFAVAGAGGADRKAPVHLLLGTSTDVGKTTAGIAILRALRMRGQARVIALKATGTPAIAEIARYQDFGAAEALDSIDFGVPTTYPPGRDGISELLGTMLDYCFSQPADAVLVECAGDPVSANAPQLLASLQARRADFRITLAAADALGALGAKHVLAEFGLEIDLITGPCTDTAILRQRTEALCGIPAINLLRDPNAIALGASPGPEATETCR